MWGYTTIFDVGLAYPQISKDHNGRIRLYVFLKRGRRVKGREREAKEKEERKRREKKKRKLGCN